MTTAPRIGVLALQGDLLVDPFIGNVEIVSLTLAVECNAGDSRAEALQRTTEVTRSLRLRRVSDNLWPGAARNAPARFNLIDNCHYTNT